MVCEKCSSMVTLSAFSVGICDKCGCDIITPHIPSYKVCEKCAEKYGLCQQCGEKIQK